MAPGRTSTRRLVALLCCTVASAFPHFHVRGAGRLLGARRALRHMSGNSRHVSGNSFLARSNESADEFVCPTTAAGARELLGNATEPVERIPRDAAPDLPTEPPVGLADAGAAVVGGCLDGSPPLAERAVFQVRRTIASVTGMDYTVQEQNGSYMFGTRGDFWTIHRHTSFFNNTSGRPVGEFKAELMTLRSTFDILAYQPLCPDQDPEECDSFEHPLFRFAKVTKWLQPMWPRWTVERYNCDGSVGSVVWEITSRFWFSATNHYDMTSPGVDGIVGTLDQSSFFQLASTNDMWLAPGQDLALGASTAILVDALRIVSAGSGGSSSRRRR